MGLIQKLFDRDSKSGRVVQEISNSVLSVIPQCSDYENLFAQVRPLVDEMMTVDVYGVGRNGAKLPMRQTPELNVLNYPNDVMGKHEFLNLAMTTWLTEREVNIRVHLSQNNKVEGYTVLPVGCRSRTANGVNQFQVYTSNMGVLNLTDAEVMTLRYSRSPRNSDLGVSPATAAHFWAVIDDVVAQYQLAFFENGATPATITFITASSRDSFEKKREELERGLKGARNKNKTIYVYRQLLADNTTGDEIEVKTIQGNNSTLALREVIDIVTNKLNMNFGVSNFIMGDDSSAKYDNAELSDHQFTKRRVYPALVMFWSEFQFELDRITGGLGYGINFEIEIPELTDRVRVQAETKRIEAETRRIDGETENAKANLMLTLVKSGADPVSACSATGLVNRSWLNVATSIKQSTMSSPLLLNAGYSHQHTTKDKNDVYQPIWTDEEKDAKAIFTNLMDFAREIAQQLVVNNPVVPLEEATEKIYEILKGTAQQGSELGAEAIRLGVADEAVASAIAKEISDGAIVPSTTLEKTLHDRTELVVSNFSEEVREIAKNIIESAENQFATQKELQSMLEDVLPVAKAETIARNESHSAILAGRYDTDRQLASKYGLSVELEWVAHLDGATCPVCRAMNGTITKLGDAFPDHIMTEDGEISYRHSLYNDGGRQCNAHPNCRCTFVERFSR